MSAVIVPLPGAAAGPIEQARMEHALTVKHPVSMAGSRVFEVREGVPLADAMDTLALLLATAQAASYGVATTAESTPENPGVPWATVYLLELAGDLHASIHAGLKQAQEGGL